jgi:glycosyltransferase involved in cell wall biosynthesis
MRVLYLTMNPNRQSTTVPTEGWFRLLPARGLSPVLVTRTSGAFAAWARSRGVPVYEDPLPFPDKRRPAAFFRSLAALRRIIRRHRIQLIHCNEQDVYPIGQYAARLTGLPVVVSVHFTMERGFCEWAYGGRRQPDRIFFVSRGNLEACRAAVDGVIDESRRRVMYNGLDLNQYTPDDALRTAFRTKFGVTEDIVIGVACALRPRKQLEHLVEAASRVASPRLRVAIAGGPVPGDENYAEALLRRAREQLGNRVLLLGHVEDLRGFYNALDIFVNTSEEEACSISVMEALASGCPVLGYASKSVDDQILPGGGEIVPQDDINALSARLSSWVSSVQELKSRRRSARQRAVAVFDIESLSQQLWQEYLDILPLPLHSASRPV